MISNDIQSILEYFKALLNDLHVSAEAPENVGNDATFLELDQALKTIRAAAVELGNGNLSHSITGKGYVLGSIKNLQASLRNLTWITKAIASGDFSQRVHFLGDFSEAFTYGHQIGDRVLIELVTILHNHVRDGDVVGRWGGEEFLIILPNTTLADATVLAERLRQAVANYAFSTAGRVTISLGVSAFATDNSPESIVSRADTALYLAKEKGRNRVEVK